MKGACRSVKLGRAWPFFSVPIEALRMVLEPAWLNPRLPPARLGVGASFPYAKNPSTQKLSVKLMVAIRLSGS
eukprot:3589451-Prorocentrum_lima.AAC.1